MSHASGPLVSVVTPVYNGEAYLAECIESVLAQTYQNWEYVILDNCSTDRTREIAESFASADSRIRVLHNDRLLEIIQNWNHAVRQISPESQYCKVIHADDCLFPECIETMVELAERNPTVGIVGSYRLDGSRPRPSPGLPHVRSVFPGVEICRGTLRQEYSLFGSPSSLLVRSSLVRDRERFYDERYLHSDKIVCLQLLREWDFGFIPQLLTYTRIHEESQSVSLADRYGTRILDNFLMQHEFGPKFLPGEESREREKAAEWRYYRFLARRLVSGQRKEILRYHSRRLRVHGRTIETPKLVAAAVIEAVDRLLEPKDLAQRLSRFLKGDRGSRLRGGEAHSG
jgi:glycosyltransferase involved in cell wall biosynthesis